MPQTACKNEGSSKPASNLNAAPSMQADWSAYAEAYDLLSDHNPAYQALMQDFEDFLKTIDAPKVIYDIGGGTGNYTGIAARAFPRSHVHLIEPDPMMLQAAQFKLSDHKNISYHNMAFEDVRVSGGADLVVCVHALYAMPEQHRRLRDLRRLTRKGGYLYLIDLGRHMDVPDWRRYLFAELKKKYGLVGALKVFWQGRQVAKQNKAISEAQEKGVYWTHTSDEFASDVSDAGFHILRQQSVYRDYSDLLVCRAR